MIFINHPKIQLNYSTKKNHRLLSHAPCGITYHNILLLLKIFLHNFIFLFNLIYTRSLSL